MIQPFLEDVGGPEKDHWVGLVFGPQKGLLVWVLWGLSLVAAEELEAVVSVNRAMFRGFGRG